MSSNVHMPPPRDMAAEGEKSLEAQIRLAPDVYKARAEYDPKYAQLNLGTLNQTLFGSGGNAGLLDIYKRVAPELTELSATAQSGQRERDIADVERLGPRAAQALSAADPRAALENRLAQQAQSELDAGASLDPALARSTAQAVRAAQGARGLGFGGSDASVEGLFMGREAEQLRRARQNFAGGVAKQLRGVTGDPFMAILGRGSSVPGMTAGVAGEGKSFTAGAPSFDPFNAYGSDLFNTNFNAASSGAIANANNANALTAAGISAAGSVGSAI